MISFVALILSMSVPDSMASFRSNPVTRDTACQSVMYIGREREHCMGNNIISYGSFPIKTDKYKGWPSKSWTVLAV